jgi:hypothetical protein
MAKKATTKKLKGPTAKQLKEMTSKQRKELRAGCAKALSACTQAEQYPELFSQWEEAPQVKSLLEGMKKELDKQLSAKKKHSAAKKSKGNK